MSKHCCHSPLSEEKAKKILSDLGINRTQIKLSLIQELSLAHKPLSVNELYEKLKVSCDLSTVFRSLTQFKEKGIVQEVNFEEGFHRYELTLNDDQEHHHHHVRCRICGDIQNIEKCDLSPFEKAIAKLGFKEMEHKLEFTGVCSRCQKA